MKTSSLTSLALAAAVAALAGNAMAQTAAPAAAPAPAAAKAPEPDYTLTGNLGIFSDYRFRGISQTNKLPAIQGGVDLALKNGLYLGNWNSNVDSAMYNGASIEMDFYGGYKATFGDFGLDVGRDGIGQDFFSTKPQHLNAHRLKAEIAPLGQRWIAAFVNRHRYLERLAGEIDDR